MNSELSANETYYRSMISATGVAMIWLLILMNAVGLFMSGVQFVLDLFAVDAVAADVIYQLTYAAGYLLMFMLPVAILKRSVNKRGYSYAPMRAEPRLSPKLPAIIFGGILLIWTQAYLNSAMVSIFQYSAFSSEVLWEDTSSYEGYQIVLQFVVMALVPAFCEEFLFRGAILTNLLPFGRVNAILISSLLFGLMHQNAEQILYAFAAGILMGVVYERTESIWNCVFLHLVNNFLSFATGIAAEKLSADLLLSGALIESLICIAGMGCLVILVKVLAPQKPTFEDGVFGKSLPAADGYAACPIAAKRSFRLFFSFPMVVFLAYAVLQTLLLIGMAVLYGMQ